MARLIGENPGGEERSLLGGALSFEFSDCSIAAADLSKIAGEHIANTAQKSENRASKYVIGDGEVQERLVYTSVDYYGRDFSLDGSQTRLVLAQRVGTQERTTERRVRKWLIPRQVSQTESTEELRDIPFLAVTVGNDTILPIASFARRSGGQCSYVQLGQEMYDDNFYVTTADDETVRHDLIESLREQIASGASYNLKENPQRTGTIQHFIDRQAETQQSALAQAYEQQLVRKSFDRLEQANKGSLTVIGEDHLETPEQYEISTLIPSCILEDGRQVSLVLARPTTQDGQWLGDRLGLFSVTREGVASQLASMSTQFMQIELSDGINLSPNERDKTIRDLLLLIIARTPIQQIETPEKEKYDSGGLEGEDRQIAEYLFGEGMLGEYEKYRSRDYHRSNDKTKIEPHVKRQLESFFAYPDPKYSPFPMSSPLKLALSRLNRRNTQDRELLTRLQAGKSFAETLGEARRCDEVLMHYVGKLALAKEGLGAVFHNVQIGKTKAGAKVAASVVTNNGVYELSINGRPESMPDEPMKQLLGANLNPRLPRLGQAGLNGAFSETRVDELIDIVSRIISVNNQ